MLPNQRVCMQAPQGIVKRGLVAWYDFTDAAGSQVLADKSGNGYHGQNGSTAGSDTNDVTFNGSYASFGGDDYIAATLSGQIKDVVIAFYVGSAVTYNTSGEVLLSPGNNGMSNDFIGIGNIAGGVTNEVICIGDVGGGRSSWISTTEQIPAGWNYLECVWNGTVFEIELNFAPRTVTKGSVPVALQANSACLGKLSLSSSYFTGYQSYIMLYNRPLAIAERKQNYATIKRALAQRGIALP